MQVEGTNAGRVVDYQVWAFALPERGRLRTGGLAATLTVLARLRCGFVGGSLDGQRLLRRRKVSVDGPRLLALDLGDQAMLLADGFELCTAGQSMGSVRALGLKVVERGGKWVQGVHSDKTDFCRLIGRRLFSPAANRMRRPA